MPITIRITVWTGRSPQ